MISITRGRGFHLTFDNGWTISVQIGWGNYCANYDRGSIDTEPEPSPNAEIAVWHTDGEFIELNGDAVQGYVSTEKVGRAITFVQTGQIDELCEMLGAQPKRIINPVVADILGDDAS
jgi:hypothetical protein